MLLNFVSVANAAAVDKAGWEARGCSQDGVATIKGIECLIENILFPLPSIIALVAVAMIIMAGIRIMNAGPDAKTLAAGWSTFTYAIIGLILLSVVWLAIVIISKYTGTDVTQFAIPTN